MNVVPRRLGRYELRQEIGRGDVGEVWKAFDLQLRRDVAMKIVHTDLQSDPHFLSNFTQEGQELISLRHANLVQVHDVAVWRSAQGNDTTAYILMEYVEGQTLVDYINTIARKDAFPPLAEIVYLFTSLGVAIDYAHQRGIVHGNLKPSNILLDQWHTTPFQIGEPMVTDLGLLRLIGNAGVVGSPFYMSPEQAKGQEPGSSSDIYSLGVILYELCTGVQPFRDKSSVAVMMQHINALPAPPILINPDLPPALSEVILRAMAKDANMRFPMASLLAAAVADACSIQSTIAISGQRIAAAKQEDGPSSTAGESGLPVLRVSQPLTALSFPLPKTPVRISTTSQSLSAISRLPQPYMPISTQQSALLASSGKQAALISAPVTPTSKGEVSTPAAGVNVSGAGIVGTNRAQGDVASSVPLHAVERDRRSADMAFYGVVAVVMVVLLVLVGVIGEWLFSQSPGQVAHPVVGHIFFQDDALGHDDTLRLDMQHIPPPPQGKTYVAWIQDSSRHVLSLGPLTAQNGSASLLYAGDGEHTNLLAVVQSIMVTLEDTASQLSTPRGTTVYQASVDPASIQYIKNILYETPTLPAQQSVIVDLFETIKSMNDKADSIVDSLQGTHDGALVIRQATRIIELIDGTPYARSSGDLPANDPAYINTPIGLLSSSTQVGYIDLLARQLDQLSAIAGNNPSLLQHVRNVKNAVADLQDWLQKMRTYDVQVLKAADLNNPAVIGVALQLKQAAADSYTGRTIPPNEGPQPILGSAGAYQAYTEAQYMATLEVRQV